MNGTLTAIGSKVTKNFRTHSEAEAFQDGVKVLSGMLGKHISVTLCNILPLEDQGYTTGVVIGHTLAGGIAE